MSAFEGNWWRIVGGITLGAGLAVLSSASVYAYVPMMSIEGVARLTVETYNDAIACGYSGEDCAVTPYLICPAPDAKFLAYFATPFSRVASGIFEASKTRTPIKPMSLGEANGWGVGVYVMPGPNPRTADSIQTVVIMRTGKIIEPLTATVVPGVYRGTGSPPLSKGFFAFPMTVLSPTTSIKLIFTGTSGTMECSLDHLRLESLR
jgi:hypothetical protein